MFPSRWLIRPLHPVIWMLSLQDAGGESLDE